MPDRNLNLEFWLLLRAHMRQELVLQLPAVQVSDFYTIAFAAGMIRQGTAAEMSGT